MIRAGGAPRCAIPEELVEIEGLSDWIVQFNDGDLTVSHVHVVGDANFRADLASLEVEGSRVERCSYGSCDFSKAVFTDVAFSGCDFSNCDFSESSFTRCTFASCKFTGADFREASLELIDMRDSTCSYASFAKARFEDVFVAASDFSHADIVEARLRRASFDDVRFVGTSFFRTDLFGIDLTACQLADIVLSDAMGELRGCTMDLYQAAGIAQRLGVIVEG